MDISPDNINLFTDKHIWCDFAHELVENYLGSGVNLYRGSKGDKLPRLELGKATPLNISFLSPFIIPKSVLDNSGLSINFHPGTRHYPGYGCYNFALYEEAREYGVVCHHMEQTVDTGKIIEEMTFPVFKRDSVETLQYRSFVFLLSMLTSILSRLCSGENFANAEIAWSRRPFTRKDLVKLTEFSKTMDGAEIDRRIRATAYPGHPVDLTSIGRGIEDLGDRPPLAFSFNAERKFS